MHPYRNVLLSLGFFILAPVWLLLLSFITHLFIIMPPQAPSAFWNASFTWPYILFLGIGTFFGWKNLKSEHSYMIGNIITILGIILSLGSVAFYFWALSWNY